METLEDRIERHEALRVHPYDDKTGMRIYPGEKYLGKMTIGIGRCLDTHPLSPEEIKHIGHDGRKLPITPEQARWLLRRDIAECRAAVEQSFPWAESMTQARQEVLIEMIFQMGLSNVQEFVNTLAAMKRSDYDAAAAGMKASLWYSQTPGRAAELAEFMRKG